MPNVASQISSHNIKVIEKCSQASAPKPRKFNCDIPEDCPLDGNYLERSVIYQANVSAAGNGEYKYIGLCEPTFKGRYGDHILTLKNKK